MSTSIDKIKCRTNSKEQYNDSYVHVNRFWGGKSYGRMIQLTFQNGSYVQLTEKQVAKLRNVLHDCFNDNIYPSE